jgi:hypothetical protein
MIRIYSAYETGQGKSTKVPEADFGDSNRYEGIGVRLIAPSQQVLYPWIALV